MRVKMRSGVRGSLSSHGRTKWVWIQIRGRVGSLQDTCYDTERDDGVLVSIQIHTFNYLLNFVSIVMYLPNESKLFPNNNYQEHMQCRNKMMGESITGFEIREALLKTSTIPRLMYVAIQSSTTWGRRTPLLPR